MLLKIVIVLTLLNVSFASAGKWEERRSSLDKVVLFDKFRVFYTLSGIEQLPKNKRLDINHNNIPDFIDNIVERLAKANTFFIYNVGLQNPLLQKRYRNQAHFIDVHILNFSQNKQGPKNGIAYDGTPKFNRSLVGLPSVNVLAIDISNTVNINNNTVEHELFHLFQNGYTYFKNRWFTEGTARWSERIINGQIGEGTQLPQTTKDRQELFAKTYNAKLFWNELMLKTDRNNQGKKFIKYLLEELDRQDDLAAISRGIFNKNWKESEQRNHANNLYIWQAIIAVNKRFPYTKNLQALSRL